VRVPAAYARLAVGSQAVHRPPVVGGDLDISVGRWAVCRSEADLSS